MSAEPAAPALPWASNAQQPNDDKIDVDLPRTLNLTMGTARIEVKWRLDDDSNEETELKTIIKVRIVFKLHWPPVIFFRNERLYKQQQISFKICSGGQLL